MLDQWGCSAYGVREGLHQLRAVDWGKERSAGKGHMLRPAARKPVTLLGALC